MKIPRGVKAFEIGLYHVKVIIFKNKKQIDTFLRINKLDEDYFIPGADGFAVRRDRENYYMGSNNWTASTITHESIHIAHFIMEAVGIPINCENTEVESHLGAYIAEQAFKFIKPKR